MTVHRSAAHAANDDGAHGELDSSAHAGLNSGADGAHHRLILATAWLSLEGDQPMMLYSFLERDLNWDRFSLRPACRVLMSQFRANKLGVVLLLVLGWMLSFLMSFSPLQTTYNRNTISPKADYWIAAGLRIEAGGKLVIWSED